MNEVTRDCHEVLQNLGREGFDRSEVISDVAQTRSVFCDPCCCFEGMAAVATAGFSDWRHGDRGIADHGNESERISRFDRKLSSAERAEQDSSCSS
jgi:hypothetical protein